MQNTAFIIIIMLLMMAGIIWLQIFLSKKQNKWLGLMIPLICFIFSIVTVLSLSAFTMITNTGSTTITETMDGVIVKADTFNSQLDKPKMGSLLATILPVFLLANIPTLLFLAIYIACREDVKKKLELKKMNIQDLE